MKNSPERKLRSSIKPGTVFALGDHRLACGDCRSPQVVEKLFGKDSASIILTDPPYGVMVVESKKDFGKRMVDKKIENDDITKESEYVNFTEAWLRPVMKKLKQKNSIYIFNVDVMIFAVREGMKRCGIHFSQLVIWIKNHAPIGRKDYLPMHELIAYGWYGKHEFQRSKDKSVLFFPKPNRSPYHPTSKPVGLLRKLILNSTKIGDIVYDPFGGGGSTLLAAEQTKRRCFIVEIDPEYCNTIISRFEKLTGIKAKKL